MEQRPEFGVEQEVVTELDLAWACSHDPCFTLANEFPVLNIYLDDALLTMRHQLRSSGIKPGLLHGAGRRTADTAAKAALALRRGLWQDLLPRIGARDVLLSQYPLDRGPASSVPSSKSSVSVYEYYWRPSEWRRRSQWRLPSEPHRSESILDAFDILSAIVVNHNPACLDRFPVLMRYVEQQTQYVGIELTMGHVSSSGVEAALKPVRLIPMVAVVAMHHAIWKGLMPVSGPHERSGEPTLF